MENDYALELSRENRNFLLEDMLFNNEQKQFYLRVCFKLPILKKNVTLQHEQLFYRAYNIIIYLY